MEAVGSEGAATVVAPEEELTAEARVEVAMAAEAMAVEQRPDK